MRRRLRKLEQAKGVGECPECVKKTIEIVWANRDGSYPSDEPCPVCGRPPRVIQWGSR